MTITYLGELSVGGAVPGCTVAVNAGTAGIDSALSNLLLQLQALQNFAPRALDFVAQLELAKQMVAGITVAMQAGLSPPSMDAQIAIIAAQAAQLTAMITGIQGQLDILLTLVDPLAAAGVHAYAYAGPVAQFGDELDAALSLGVPGGGGPAEASNGVVLMTTLTSTWDAMGVILKVTP